MLFVGWALFAALQVVPPLLSQESTMTPKSVCSVIDIADRSNGRKIALRAELETDGIHATILSDDHCKAGVLLTYSDEARRNGHAKALNELLFSRGRNYTFDKEIRGVFEGTFRYHANSEVRYEISVDRVRELSVKTKVAESKQK